VKISNCHERVVAAPPETIAALVADFGRVWPTQIEPAPRPQGAGLYKAGIMLWQEYDRPGAARAFRVVSPEGFRVEHWFTLEPVEGGTLLRHTLKREAVSEAEAIWRRQAEPSHDVALEALLDRVEVTVASEDWGAEQHSQWVCVGMPIEEEVVSRSGGRQRIRRRNVGRVGR
jgi:hypothetical protein